MLQQVYKIIFLLSLTLLTACSPPMVKSTKVDPDAVSIKDLTFAISTGNILSKTHYSLAQQIAIRDSFKGRFVDLLNKNGVSTKKSYISGVDDFDIYPKTLAENATTSHVLLMTAESLEFINYVAMYIHFNAILIDVNSKKIVWRGKPMLPLSPYRPNLSTQVTAGGILNALHQSGLIHLAQEPAVDMDGQPIKGAYTKFYLDGRDH